MMNLSHSVTKLKNSPHIHAVLPQLKPSFMSRRAGFFGQELIHDSQRTQLHFRANLGLRMLVIYSLHSSCVLAAELLVAAVDYNPKYDR